MSYVYSIYRILLSCSLIFSLFTTSVHAQDDLDEFIEAGSADASAIYGAYGTPLLSGMNWAFSRGWYNTAKAHKPLGFDFSMNVSVALVPDKDEFFDASKVQSLWNANAAAANRPATRFVGNSTKYPTMVGPDNSSGAPQIEIWNPVDSIFKT